MIALRARRGGIRHGRDRVFDHVQSARVVVGVIWRGRLSDGLRRVMEGVGAVFVFYFARGLVDGREGNPRNHAVCILLGDVQRVLQYRIAKTEREPPAVRNLEEAQLSLSE